MLLKELLKVVDFNTIIDLCTEDFFQVRLFSRNALTYAHIDAYLDKEILDITTNDNCLLIRICD